MSDQSVKLGQLIQGTEYRDAIHIAVCPVVAAERLLPGRAVGLVDGEKAGITSKPIGIVDPFLGTGVEPGQRFWLLLYPGSITSLRHEWTHPAFTAEQVGVDDRQKAESEKWLREYAAELNSYDGPEVAFERLIDGLKTRMMKAHGGRSLYGFDDLDNADELRFHAERYLGIRINWDDYSFSCSC